MSVNEHAGVTTSLGARAGRVAWCALLLVLAGFSEYLAWAFQAEEPLRIHIAGLVFGLSFLLAAREVRGLEGPNTARVRGIKSPTVRLNLLLLVSLGAVVILAGTGAFTLQAGVGAFVVTAAWFAVE